MGSQTWIFEFGLPGHPTLALLAASTSRSLSEGLGPQSKAKSWPKKGRRFLGADPLASLASGAEGGNLGLRPTSTFCKQSAPFLLKGRAPSVCGNSWALGDVVGQPDFGCRKRCFGAHFAAGNPHICRGVGPYKLARRAPIKAQNPGC